MPGRKFNAANSGYRYGFNGKEDDKDAGEGIQDYGMRIYSERLGKFLSVDPLFKNFAYYSPYHFAGNNPIRNLDLDGGEPLDYTYKWLYKNTYSALWGTENGKASFYGLLYPGVPETVPSLCDVNAIYDKVSKQYWFIHSINQNFYYWKHNPGADQAHFIISNKPGQSNGQWEPFQTRGQIDAEFGAAIADGMGIAVFAGVTAIAAGIAAPVLADLGLDAMARVTIFAYNRHKLINTLGTLGTGVVDPSGQSGNTLSGVYTYGASSINKFISTEQGALWQVSKFKQIITKGGIEFERMMLQPIETVMYNGKQYILDGHNRLKAFAELGKDAQVTVLSLEEATKKYKSKMEDVVKEAFNTLLENDHE